MDVAEIFTSETAVIVLANEMQLLGRSLVNGIISKSNLRNGFIVEHQTRIFDPGWIRDNNLLFVTDKKSL